MNLNDPLVIQTQARWNEASGSPVEHLLKLAILREFSRSLHAKISHCLAEGKTPEAKSLEFVGQALEHLPAHRRLENISFESIVQELSTATAPLPALPPPSAPAEIIQALGARRILRQDRTWEQHLAHEASARGWNLWCLEAEVPLTGIEAWNEGLIQKLWPRGILLFVESAHENTAREPNTPTGTWVGHWTLLAEPAVTEPQTLWGGHLPVTGTSESGAHLRAPTWTRLHPSARGGGHSERTAS